MAVYVIASPTIKDAVRFEDYKRMLAPSREKYGERFIARGPIHVVEGEWPRERLIIGEFPSMERALDRWDSPEYAKPKALRLATADSEAVVVQGVYEELRVDPAMHKSWKGHFALKPATASMMPEEQSHA